MTFLTQILLLQLKVVFITKSSVMQRVGVVLAHCTVQGENRLVCIFGGLPISNAIVNNALACRHRNFSLKFAGLKVGKAKMVLF